LIASFDLKVEQFSMLAPKESVTCSRIELGEKIDDFAVNPEDYRQ
jgi:hypothetical protein